MYWVESSSKCTKYDTESAERAVEEHLLSIEANYSFSTEVLVHYPDGTSKMMLGYFGCYPNLEGVCVYNTTFSNPSKKT